MRARRRRRRAEHARRMRHDEQRLPAAHQRVLPQPLGHVLGQRHQPVGAPHQHALQRHLQGDAVAGMRVGVVHHHTDRARRPGAARRPSAGRAPPAMAQMATSGRSARTRFLPAAPPGTATPAGAPSARPGPRRWGPATGELARRRRTEDFRLGGQRQHGFHPGTRAEAVHQFDGVGAARRRAGPIARSAPSCRQARSLMPRSAWRSNGSSPRQRYAIWRPRSASAAASGNLQIIGQTDEVRGGVGDVRARPTSPRAPRTRRADRAPAPAKTCIRPARRCRRPPPKSRLPDQPVLRPRRGRAASPRPAPGQNPRCGAATALMSAQAVSACPVGGRRVSVRVSILMLVAPAGRVAECWRNRRWHDRDCQVSAAAAESGRSPNACRNAAIAPSGFFRSKLEARLQDTSTTTASSGSPKSARPSAEGCGGATASGIGTVRTACAAPGGSQFRKASAVNDDSPQISCTNGRPARQVFGSGRQLPRPVADHPAAAHQAARRPQQGERQQRRVHVQQQWHAGRQFDRGRRVEVDLPGRQPDAGDRAPHDPRRLAEPRGAGRTRRRPRRRRAPRAAGNPARGASSAVPRASMRRRGPAGSRCQSRCSGCSDASGTPWGHRAQP